MAEVAEKEVPQEEETPQAIRDRTLRRVVSEWNSLIDSLLSVKKSWDNYCELMLDHNVSIEEFPLECQKALVLANPKGELDFILEDMITRGRQWTTWLEEHKIRIK